MKASVCIILIEADKVFLAPRLKAQDNPNTLGFPGGKSPRNEPPTIAALRELREETGIQARPSELKRIGVLQAQNPDYGKYRLYVFCLRLGERKPRQTEPDKLGDWEALAIGEVLRMPERKLLSGTKPALAMMLAASSPVRPEPS